MKSEFFQQLAPFLKETGLDLTITVRSNGDNNLTVMVQPKLPSDIKSTVLLVPLNASATPTILDEQLVPELVKSLNRQRDVFAGIKAVEKSNADILEAARKKAEEKSKKPAETKPATPAKPEAKKAAPSLDLFNQMAMEQKKEVITDLLKEEKVESDDDDNLQAVEELPSQEDARDPYDNEFDF